MLNVEHHSLFVGISAFDDGVACTQHSLARFVIFVEMHSQIVTSLFRHFILVVLLNEQLGDGYPANERGISLLAFKLYLVLRVLLNSNKILLAHFRGFPQVKEALPVGEQVGVPVDVD